MGEGVTIGPHWWTFGTWKGPDDVADTIGGGWSGTEFKSLFFQPKMRRHESGITLHFGSGRELQPTVVNASGEVCETWSPELPGWTVALGGWLTRLDVALDLEPPELARTRLRSLWRSWQAGSVVTKLRRESCDFHISKRPREGATAYFGSRGGGAMLRVYDRRGPLRLEWEFRPGNRDVGACVVDRVQRVGYAPVWRRLASRAVFPQPWYRELLEGETCDWQLAVDRESQLAEVLEHLRGQFGATLQILEWLGVCLQDLAVMPERPDYRAMAKWLRWADEAGALGLNGERVRSEVTCRWKSKRR